MTDGAGQEGGGRTAPRRLLTRADVRDLLDRHGLAPRKAHGQNFLVDPNSVRKIVRDAEVGRGDLVCEVGPGLGSLTLGLREAGAYVLAVEIDAGFVRALDEVLDGDPGVLVLHDDALRQHWEDTIALGRERWPDAGPAVLAANLPYNVATPLVIEALSAGVFSRLHVMVQREVGERWTAVPGDPAYSAVSVKIAALADARIASVVGRGVFEPEPRVGSVTVALVPHPPLELATRHALFALVEAGFRQRRKRLRNALAGVVGAADDPAAAVEEALVAAGLDRGARAEELDLAAWQRLADRMPRA